jgi:hypothetical protein
VENEVQRLARLGYWKVKLGWEKMVRGRVEYLDAEEMDDEGGKGGGGCEADAGGCTGYDDDLWWGVDLAM